MPQEVWKVGDTMNPMEDMANYYKLTITNNDGSPYMTLHIAGDKLRVARRTYLEEGFEVAVEAMDNLPEGVELDIA